MLMEECSCTVLSQLRGELLGQRHAHLGLGKYYHISQSTPLPGTYEGAYSLAHSVIKHTDLCQTDR